MNKFTCVVVDDEKEFFNDCLGVSKERILEIFHAMNSDKMSKIGIAQQLEYITSKCNNINEVVTTVYIMGSYNKNSSCSACPLDMLTELLKGK